MAKTKLKAASIYLTPVEYSFLKKESQDHGVSLSYFLRALINQYSPVKLPPLQTGAPKKQTTKL